MLLKLILLAILAYLGLAFFLYVGQRRILFPATKTIYRTPEVYGWAYEDIYLDSDGHRTHAWHIPAPGEAKGTILFSHGNAGNVADRLESVGIFRAMGLDVLVYDYGGYGNSEGSPSEQRCYADAMAAWRCLTQTRGLAPERIVLFGRSLGGAVTADLATRVKPAGAIIESTFLSVPERAKEMYPMFPARWLVRYRFDNAAKAGLIACPVLVVHSPGDTLVPYRHGREIYNRVTAPKAFLQINGDHNDGFVATGEPYHQGLRDFIDRCLSSDGFDRTPPEACP